MSASTSRGFTLIELLVAISIMALMAVLSWRGLDGMTRTQTLISQRADEVLTLQAGLAQWKLDLDMLAPTPNVTPIDWDGRVLRLTRRTATAGEGLQVVAWSRRNEAGGQWLRWQSPVVRTAGSWRDAWERAGVWAQNANAADRAREVRVSALEDWQIFYFRGGAWSNPLSSAGTAVPSAANAGIATSSPSTAIPDGIRLVLTLPAGQAISGKLTMDWVAPTLGGDKS
jgi:general secretion pathway protein J